MKASHGIANIEARDIILSRQRTTKVLNSLHGCAGWCVPLLFACDVRQVFSWRGSYVVCSFVCQLISILVSTFHQIQCSYLVSRYFRSFTPLMNLVFCWPLPVSRSARPVSILALKSTCPWVFSVWIYLANCDAVLVSYVLCVIYSQ